MTTETTTRTETLRRLAMAATPGPWRTDEFLAIMPGEPLVGPGAMPPEIALANPMRGSWDQQRADAAYIAAVSPDVVLALLDVVEAAWEDEIHSLFDFHTAGRDEADPVMAAVTRLRAALDRLAALDTPGGQE